MGDPIIFTIKFPTLAHLNVKNNGLFTENNVKEHDWLQWAKNLNPWLTSLHTTSFNFYEQKIVTL